MNTASEKYFMSILQLFLPFRTDKQLKPLKFQTYQEFYELGSVKLYGSKLQKVNVIVDENMERYDKTADAIKHAEGVLAKFGPQEDAWGLLCPESEKERLENPKPNVDVDDEENEFFVPDFGLKKNETSTIECNSSSISRPELNKMIRSLNKQQKQIFYKTRQWCLDKVNGKQPESFYTFITGGAGTGKSHLVNCIYNEATRILGKMLENPDDMSILKLAPTGIAAYNIKGHTIHSALSIPIHISLPYQPLGEEKISALRNQLGQLQIVIIDEISMVNQKLLWYIHGRLRQIKQVRNDSAFGNISIIAVGDFYQLPPVRGTSLYKNTLENSLWVDNFKKVQLDEIMRQKEDKEFAVLLNKLRTKERNDCLSDKDLSVLKSCETGEQCDDAVHIYPCNKQVNEWNKTMLHKTCLDIICIEAEDTVVNSKKQDKHCDKPRKSCQTNLLNYLWIALNARVMLIKNVDVKKGLTNGCMGHVEEIIKPSPNAKPISIKVKFDNKDIGIQAIEMFQESIGKKYSRKQFPLKLAYACTVHKVQGMTMNKALVCLKNTFAPGQAYVALSRVTSISGLTIEHVNSKLIYCDPTIKEYLNKMNSYIQCDKEVNDSGSEFSIMLHNIQGLKQHFADLQCNDLIMNSTTICLTETWLNKDDDFVDLSIEPYKFYHQARYDSYSNKNDYLKNQAHGGVAVYTKNKFSSRLDIGINDIEETSITAKICMEEYIIIR
ncbi:ATP-dependent DNA helicase pif1-like [Antedon mediterranea]|uniref:ATP-dependent DNA helicase pif1-like n=1 Tax=Antedon mediterranea TaxID=105859 RepID=UPI003AF5362B